MAKESRSIKAKVIRTWTHKGEPTEAGKSVDLTPSEYRFCLDKKVVEKSPDAPLETAAGEEVS